MIDLDDPERYLEQAIPDGLFHCSKCFKPIQPEEWHIPPYEVMHGLCPEHGPQWGFKPSVSQERRAKVRLFRAPYYRCPVPDILAAKL